MKRFPAFAAIAVVLSGLLLGVSGIAFGAGPFTVYLPLTQSSNATMPPPTIGPTAEPTAEPTVQPTVEPALPKTFFLPFEIGSVNNTTDTSLALDPAGGVHMSYGTVPHTYAIYSYCAANCTDKSKFSAVRFGGIEDDQRIYDVIMALDPAGHPRMLWNTNAGWQYAACDADCINPASWTATVIAPAGSTEHSSRFVIDKQGRAHLIDYGASQYGSLDETHYITCAANCTDAANWTRTQISPAAYSKPSLAVTAAGQPRIVFQTFDFDDDRFETHDNRLGYAACDTNCTDAANWSTTLRFDEVDQYDGSWSLALDPQERPRVALAPWRPYGSDTAENQLYYMWCDAACSDAAGSWGITRLTTPEEEVSAVDLALDSANRPQMSFSFSSDQDGVAYGMYHGRCLATCESVDGDWEFNLIDSTEALNTSEPVNDTGICSNPTRPTWSLGGTSALALDGAGKAQVAYDAIHLWTCYSNGNIKVQRDINWVRYAPAR